MPVDLDSEIRAYAAMVRHCTSYEDDEEMIYVLHWRDAIHSDLPSGGVLDPDLLVELATADASLLRQRDEVVTRFPDVFHVDRKRNKPRDHWWWYLDEGPQVREEAGQAA